jgi:UrcA family protein
MNTTSPSKLRRVLTITVFSALTSGAALCSAADGDSLQTTVNYSDLNVSSAQGAGTLYSRIRAAAEKVCRPLDRDDLASKQLFHTCVSTAISGAVGKVDQPALFSVYNAKTGTAKPIVLASSQGR